MYTLPTHLHEKYIRNTTFKNMALESWHEEDEYEQMLEKALSIQIERAEDFERKLVKEKSIRMHRNVMEKLSILLNRCKCGVYLTVNEHRDDYCSVEQWLNDKNDRECPPDIDQEMRQKMILTNTVICCQFYPDTPIGSYEVYHYDLNQCLEESLACLDINT